MTNQQTTVERETVSRPARPAATYVGDGPPADDYGRVRVTEQYVDTGPSGYAIATRIAVVIFGIIQLLILLRIGLLLIDAQQGNPIVDFIMNVSAPLVAPFEGILRRDDVSSAGSTLDLTAIVALIGWTILELVVLAIIRIARPRTAA